MPWFGLDLGESPALSILTIACEHAKVCYPPAEGIYSNPKGPADLDLWIKSELEIPTQDFASLLDEMRAERKKGEEKVVAFKLRPFTKLHKPKQEVEREWIYLVAVGRVVRGYEDDSELFVCLRDISSLRLQRWGSNTFAELDEFEFEVSQPDRPVLLLTTHRCWQHDQALATIPTERSSKNHYSTEEVRCLIEFAERHNLKFIVFVCHL